MAISSKFGAYAKGFVTSAIGTPLTIASIAVANVLGAAGACLLGGFMVEEGAAPYRNTGDRGGLRAYWTGLATPPVLYAAALAYALAPSPSAQHEHLQDSHASCARLESVAHDGCAAATVCSMPLSLVP